MKFDAVSAGGWQHGQYLHISHCAQTMRHVWSNNSLHAYYAFHCRACTVQQLQSLCATHVATVCFTTLKCVPSSACNPQVLAAMWDHLLLRTPKEIASTVCSAIMTIMQDKCQAPQHPPGEAPATAAQPTGTVSSSAQHPNSMEARQAATAAALSGPDSVPKDCDLAIALSVLGSKPGTLSQRFAMLSAARKEWPDDPEGVLALMLLEDVVLAPGEAVIIPAGCPHAYICGKQE